MQRIYLDNAATTALDPAVLEAMLPYYTTAFGNPSSLHCYGREARVAIEKARKSIAANLSVSPSEIFFTSGGTEADNTALCGALRTLGIKHIITSPIEHHAVLHTAQHLAAHGEATLHLVRHTENGTVDYDHLEELLASLPPAIVLLMHGNNEVGNLVDLAKVGTMVRAHGGYFHSDTVQTVGHFPLKLSELPVDFIAGSAHKFHGPKGIGFLYISPRVKVGPLIFGGSQERNMRGGTENVAGAVGMAHALDISCREMEDHATHIESLKAHMIEPLRDTIPGLEFNGASAEVGNSLYTVLSISLPPSAAGEMLLFRLDMAGVCASGGSACSSGAQQGSHVLNALYPGSNRAGLRFSFSKYTTHEEVDAAVAALVSVLEPSFLVEN
jgi:cysteine desulfurase